MKNRKLFLAGFLIFVVLLSSLFVFAMGSAMFERNKGNNSEKIYENGNSCLENSECDDYDSCTIDYCSDSEVCINTKVVLCYQDDDCCPKGCTAENDNDC